MCVHVQLCVGVSDMKGVSAGPQQMKGQVLATGWCQLAQCYKTETLPDTPP